jgi:acyl carrier protein
MGLDFIEVVMQIETRIGLRIHKEDFQQFVAGSPFPGDFQVGAILKLLITHPACGRCGYDLRGHTKTGTCPECGSHFDYADEERMWQELRSIIAGTLGLNEEKIHKESLLVRDLGFS